MSRIVTLCGTHQPDVRAIRASRVLAALGHEIVYVATRETGAPAALTPVDLSALDRKIIRSEKMFLANWHRNIIAAIDEEIEPDIVWCHGITALYRYTFSATYTPAIEDMILSDARLAETPWHPSTGRARLVYDLHEYELDRPHAYPRKQNISDWGERERRALPLARALVTVSDAIAELTMARRLNPRRPHVVTNAPPDVGRPLHTDAARAELKARGLEGAIIAFAGNPSPDRDLESLQLALSRFDRPASFVLMSGAQDAAREVASMTAGGRPHAMLELAYPWTEYADELTLLDYLSACDLAYNGAWIDFDNWRCGAPNKMFEYACAGVPQLAPSGMVEFERLNEVVKAGARGRIGASFAHGAMGVWRALVEFTNGPWRVDPTFYARENFEVANTTTLAGIVSEAMS